MVAFYWIVIALHVLSCIGDKLGRIVPPLNIAVHIAAFYFCVKSGGELEDMLLLLLFSIAIGLAAGDILRPNPTPAKETKSELKQLNLKQEEGSIK